jgi:hypothetical protein
MVTTDSDYAHSGRLIGPTEAIIFITKVYFYAGAGISKKQQHKNS